MARKSRHGGRDNALRSLRMYALAGDMKQAEAILQRILEQKPDDTFAQEELARLKAGEPLRITETPEERQQRETREQRDKVLALFADFKEKSLDLHHLSNRQLSRYLDIAKELPTQQQWKGFALTLASELKRRKRATARKLLLLTLSCLIILGAIAFLSSRHQVAWQKHRNLETALTAGNWDAVQAELRSANHPLYCILSTQLRHSVARAQRWIEIHHEQRDKLLRQLVDWQQNPQSFAALTDTQKADFENALSSLAYPHQELITSWQNLIKRYRQSVLHDRSAVIAELSKPLPPPPPATGNLRADEQAFTKHLHLLNDRLKFYQEASKKHPLGQEMIAPLHEQLLHTEAILRDIDAMQQLIRYLQQSPSYDHYRSLISSIKPQAYEPAIRQITLLHKLPAAEELRQIVRDGGRSISHQMLEATLIQGGPTFTPELPATRQQTVIIEKIFTSEPLHRIFYRLNNKHGETCITEKDPIVFSPAKGYHDARITLSTYDPAYSPTKPATFVWQEAETIMKTTINATPLIKATGIERETFFAQANLAHMLDTIIHTDAPYCPPLARAYLFNAILQLILIHPEPEITGISYSPTLQEDARSFLGIIHASPLEFRDGMWLRESPVIRSLNEDYARWFREHRARNYPREIADNLHEIISIRPRFAGHIDPSGTPIPCPKLAPHLKPGTRIWYLKAPDTTNPSEAQATPCEGRYGTPLDHPLPLSPFFIEQKELCP